MTRTLFRGATIVDGTGADPAVGDVAVDDGRIVEVGPGLDGDDVVELDWGQSVSIAGLKIVLLPTQHWSGRWLNDRRMTLWGSYAVIGPRQRFYFGGDTGYFDGFATIGGAYGPFDLAALPIGAYSPAEMMHLWHMTPEEALQAARDLRAVRVLPIHYGTFDLSDEEPDEPPRRRWNAECRHEWVRRPDLLLSNYRVTLDDQPSPPVAWRETRRVRFEGRRPGRPSLELLVDAETWLVLAETGRAFDGREWLRARFETITYGEVVAPDDAATPAVESIGALMFGP